MEVVVLRKRHLAKTITYRLLSTAAGFVAVWIGTDSLKAGAVFSVAELIVKPILYYLHERVWYKYLPYGLKKIDPVEVPSNPQ
jgi:uncharacterized membrane protein